MRLIRVVDFIVESKFLFSSDFPWYKKSNQAIIDVCHLCLDYTWYHSLVLETILCIFHKCHKNITFSWIFHLIFLMFYHHQTLLVSLQTWNKNQELFISQLLQSIQCWIHLSCLLWKLCKGFGVPDYELYFYLLEQIKWNFHVNNLQ